MLWVCFEAKLNTLKCLFNVLGDSVHSPCFEMGTQLQKTHKSITIIKNKILQKQSCKIL